MSERVDIEYLLENITVMSPGFADSSDIEWPSDFYAVADTGGIIAYFAREEDACRFRIDLINNYLNPATLSDERLAAK